MRNLSKSKIIAWRQCPKRLWLELHQPDFKDDSGSQAAFAIGHQVGDIARQIYDPDGCGETIDIEALGHGKALARSAELLAARAGPVFEAGISIDGALAYADVMLPDQSDGSPRWKMIEVKSSTGVRDYQRDDIAVQAYIAKSAGVELSSVSLAHIDNGFVYQGDGNYQGLLREVDITADAQSRSDEVKDWIAGAQAVAVLEEAPEVAMGSHCSAPFDCCFRAYCNLGEVVLEYPLSSLPRLHPAKRAKIESAGYDDIRDVPDDLLNDQQCRVKHSSVTGQTYFDAEAAAATMAAHGNNVYFLDFETIMFAVPIWTGTRPYQQIPFQFSLHHRHEDGQVEHHAHLDLTGADPSRAIAGALVAHCGSTGTIYAYNSGFEQRCIHGLAESCPDLADALLAINDRIIDLLPVAREHYYHPSMHGSWSLKCVLPALLPDLSYEDLDGVQDGNAAGAAYHEATTPATTPVRRAEIEQQLLAYCHLDTFALVRMWDVFSGVTTPQQCRLSKT